MITKRELSCLEMKQIIENIKEDKCKLKRRSSQNDKLEQWIMHWAVKDEVLGSILGSNKQRVFFHFLMSLLYRLKHSKLFH